MIYAKDFTIARNTTAEAPERETIPIHPGILKQFEVYFPRGCAGLVGIRVFYWEHQLFPANPDSWFIGDDTLISFVEDLVIIDAPYELQMEGYNTDDTYNHTPIVRIQVIPFDRDLTSILLAGSAGPTGPINFTEG